MPAPNFITSKIPLTETPLVGDLVRHYLDKSESVDLLFDFEADQSGINALLEKRSQFLQNRMLIQSVISNQYRELLEVGEELKPEEKANIDLLSQKNTFTVTTGHQLQLAGGPLFLAFKILSAISSARHISASFPDIQVVPVFWLASEDHDMAEIDHFDFKGEELKWKNEWTGATGMASCTGVHALIDELQSHAIAQPFAEEFIRILRDAYRPEHSLSLATRILIHRLFGRFGVISIDANDSRLKSEFAKVILEELSNHRVQEHVKKSLKKFPAAIDPQVNPREINLFYLTESSRNRIISDGDVWKVLDTELQFDKVSLLNELEAHPERFSPNVLLRPLYQSSLLPDLAYVGGPGELAYWFELSDLFSHFEIPMPVLLARNFFLHLDNPTMGKMEKAGIGDTDLFTSIEELMKRHILKKLDSNDPFPALEKLLVDEYAKIEKTLTESDRSLEASVKGELQKSIKGLQQLREKWVRSEKRKEETLKSQLERIQQAVFPGGTFQERKVSLAEYYMKYGAGILDLWLDNCAPINDSLTILKEKN